MLVWIKLLKALGTSPVGEKIQVTAADAKALIDGGMAEAVPADAKDPAASAVDDAIKGIDKLIENAVKGSLAKAIGNFENSLEVTGDPSGMVITVGAKKTDAKGGFKSLAHFAHDVYKAGPSGLSMSDPLQKHVEACKAAGIMQEGDNAGFLIPTEYATTLMQLTLEDAIILPRATSIPMAVASIELPALVDKDHSSSYFGGIKVYRPGEGGQKTKTAPTGRKVRLTLHELTGLVYLSDALIEDSPVSIEPLVENLFRQAVGFEADDEYINGTGGGQAQGILNSPCLVTVTKETNQAAATVVFENLVKMWARLYPPSQSKAIWLYNPEAFPQLATMSLKIGTGGVPVFMPAGGISGSPYGTIFGRPAIATEKCPALGDAGDIMLVDPTQYLVGRKSANPIMVASSIHLRFDYNETAFRIVLRHDGQGWWNSDLTPKRGTATLSPFVALGAR